MEEDPFQFVSVLVHNFFLSLLLGLRSSTIRAKAIRSSCTIKQMENALSIKVSRPFQARDQNSIWWLPSFWFWSTRLWNPQLNYLISNLFEKADHCTQTYNGTWETCEVGRNEGRLVFQVRIRQVMCEDKICKSIDSMSFWYSGVNLRSFGA